MILTDIEIKAEIDSGRLAFDPPLEQDGPGRQIQTCTIDLRIGPEFRVFKTHDTPPGYFRTEWVDPSSTDFNIGPVLQELTELTTVEDDGFFDLHPNVPILARTFEKVTLPPHLCARVEGRSSLARLGLTVHNTAPFIHPGYSDFITLEIFSTGPVPFRLRAGRLRVCQLILERVGSPPLEPYPGAYRQTLA